jgi:RimJ/RimL family protein N-acetyltransferase
MQVAEASLVVDYFHEASPADLERMGVDPARLPEPKAWRASLETALAAPASKATSFYSAWLVDGRPVGYAALKRIRPGVCADIHLHMWSAPHRGQGHGATLFCKSVVDAYDRFALRDLVCEPQADNPMPNRMLAKVGFPLLRTYVGSSSELSQTTSLNRYEIPRGVAEAYLAVRR